MISKCVRCAPGPLNVGTISGSINMNTPLADKSTIAGIRSRFDNDVERFSSLETGQAATIDAPLAMSLITEPAVSSTTQIRRVLDIGCGAGNNTLRLRQAAGHDFKVFAYIDFAWAQGGRGGMAAAGRKSRDQRTSRQAEGRGLCSGGPREKKDRGKKERAQQSPVWTYKFLSGTSFWCFFRSVQTGRYGQPGTFC